MGNSVMTSLKAEWIRIILQVLLILGAASQAAPFGRRTCYYGRDYEIEYIPGDLCTHVLYAFCGISGANWEVISTDPSFDIDGRGYERFVALKETYPQLKTGISIAGDPHIFSQMASLKERRDIFINSTIQFLRDFGFDGFDVDWEFPGDILNGGSLADKENYRLLIEELRIAFDAEGFGWDLSIAAPIGIFLLTEGYNVSGLCKNLDAVNLMGYDLRSHKEGFADVHSMLYRRPELDLLSNIDRNVNDGALEWEVRECPRDKIVIGVPFYGQTYILQDPEKNDLHALTKGGGTIRYSELCKKMIEEPGWIKHYDDIGLVPFTHNGEDWIGYEDVDSLKIKMNYIRTMGFLGAMNWKLEHDDYTGQCGQGINPLMRVIYEGLMNYTVPVSSLGK